MIRISVSIRLITERSRMSACFLVPTNIVIICTDFWDRCKIESMPHTAYWTQPKFWCVQLYIQTGSITQVPRNYRLHYGVTPLTRETIIKWHQRFGKPEPSKTETAPDGLQDHYNIHVMYLSISADSQYHLYSALHRIWEFRGAQYTEYNAGILHVPLPYSTGSGFGRFVLYSSPWVRYMFHTRIRK